MIFKDIYQMDVLDINDFLKINFLYEINDTTQSLSSTFFINKSNPLE